MKRKIRYKQLLFSSFLLLSAFACVREQSPAPVSSEDGLTIETARLYYEKALEKGKTKASSGQVRTNMFYREEYNEKWVKALLSCTEGVESVDVPVQEERQYYVMSRDGEGYFLTRCHHDLTIIRSVETGEMGVYHHYYIPFRSTNDAYRDEYEGGLYGDFLNNGFREDFTGLELYYDMEGRIVKLLRYYRGKRYEEIYYGDGSFARKKMEYQMRYYVTKAYGIKPHMKTKGDHSGYTCPQCGSNLRESESNLYYCSNCPWSELDFNNQEIDELIFYGEGGGGGWDYSDPDEPQIPDPNTGGGDGGGGSGNGGNAGSGDEQDIPSNFIFDDKAELQIRPILEALMEDCAAASMINALSEYDINFIERHGKSSPIEMIGKKTVSGRIVELNFEYYLTVDNIMDYALLEELFHAIQFINGNFSRNGWGLNLEIEAKYAVFLYMQKHGRVDEFPGYNVDKQCLWDYQLNATEENYLRIANYVRNLSREYADMKEDPDHRSMSNLYVLNCYDE